MKTTEFDINEKAESGNTELHKAVIKNEVEKIIALLLEGADINAKNNEGETPLFWAAYNHSVKNNYFNVATALLRLGADLSIKNNDIIGEDGNIKEKGKTTLEMLKLSELGTAPHINLAIELEPLFHQSFDKNKVLEVATGIKELNEGQLKFLGTRIQSIINKNPALISQIQNNITAVKGLGILGNKSLVELFNKAEKFITEAKNLRSEEKLAEGTEIFHTADLPEKDINVTGEILDELGD